MSASWTLALLSCVAAATAVGLGTIALWRAMQANAPMHRQASSGLSLAWRLACPWLQRLTWLTASWLGWRSRSILAAEATRAGQGPALEPAVIRAAQCLAALLAGSLLAATSWCFDLDGWMVGMAALVAAWSAWGAPRRSLRRLARLRMHRMAAELPFALEMLALCLAGGQNFNGALARLVHHAPDGVLRQELATTWAEMRQGRPRTEAVRALALRAGLPALRRLAGSLAQADALGMALGPLLQAQAGRLRDERFQAAEKRAMEAPVKMLLPLMTCIFPCTFLVLAYPLMHYLQTGWLA